MKEIYGISDVGCVRSRNEDCFKCGEFSDGVFWAVVCDGMGGEEGGEVASRLAVEEIAKKLNICYRGDLSKSGKARGGYNVSSCKNFLKSVIVTANAIIVREKNKIPELKSMGTTVVVGLFFDGYSVCANVGDSRAYIVTQENGINRISKDQTLVRSLIESGILTEERAENSELNHVITDCLGREKLFETNYIYYSTSFFDEGTSFVLCTDGLTNCVSDDEIKDVVLNNSAEDSAKLLVEKAKQNGGHDNITLVVLK